MLKLKMNHVIIASGVRLVLLEPMAPASPYGSGHDASFSSNGSGKIYGANPGPGWSNCE
jgi:hypothetical protein